MGGHDVPALRHPKDGASSRRDRARGSDGAVTALTPRCVVT